MRLEFITPALRMYRMHLKRRFFGFKKYEGNNSQIIKDIIDDCWDYKNKYFMVSSGHFKEFYIRDFCWVIESLLKLGYKKRVILTLKYALTNYDKKNKVTTTISSKRKPYDFPTKAVDSLPYLIRCLKILDDKELINKYKDFLEEQIKIHYEEFLDKETGLVKDKHFSSMKDHYRRHCSCYDNCMIGMLSMDLNELKLTNPFKRDYKKILIENFWTGSYFKDELKTNIISGDANTFPFWTGIITDISILKKSTNYVSKERLDRPFPLKYANKINNNHAFKMLSVVAKDYETNSIWTHMGLLYILVIKKIDQKKAEEYLKSYIQIVETYSNFLEVFKNNGEPYSTSFYTTDEGMIWAANLLYLLSEN